jgi:hypothetical protein
MFALSKLMLIKCNTKVKSLEEIIDIIWNAECQYIYV